MHGRISRAAELVISPDSSAIKVNKPPRISGSKYVVHNLITESYKTLVERGALQERRGDILGCHHDRMRHLP
jgi:hypothetical protein